MQKIKNIIIFVTIAAIFVLIYIFFIKPKPEEGSLVSSTSPVNVNETVSDTGSTNNTSLIAKDFLTLLLNVKDIKLNDSIFSDPAFNSLRDSSIVLEPDGTEGRPNPFAQFGSEALSANANNANSATSLSDIITPPAQP